MYVVAVCEFGGTQRTPLGRLVDSQFTTWFGFMASSEGAGSVSLLFIFLPVLGDGRAAETS